MNVGFWEPGGKRWDAVQEETRKIWCWCRCRQVGAGAAGAGEGQEEQELPQRRSAAQRNGNGNSNGEQVDGEWWVCRLQCMSACAVQAAVHEDGASTVRLLGWFFSWPVDPRLQSEALAD